jgi:hypothetical protein
LFWIWGKDVAGFKTLCNGKSVSGSEDALNLERPLHDVELELSSNLFENDLEVKLTHSTKLQRTALFILADLSAPFGTLHCQKNRGLTETTSLAVAAMSRGKKGQRDGCQK